MKAFLFLNGGLSRGDFYREHFLREKREGDLVVCADGGLRLARSLGIAPGLVVGDLDSAGPGGIPEGAEVVRYPVEKDFSDFELSLAHTVRRGPERMFVYGALGGRLDHEMINLVLLARLRLPAAFVEEMVEAHNVVGSLVLEGLGGKVCSLIALGGACRIERTEGLLYPLRDETLEPSSRGLSNVVTGARASIHAGEGDLLVIVVKGKSAS